MDCWIVGQGSIGAAIAENLSGDHNVYLLSRQTSTKVPDVNFKQIDSSDELQVQQFIEKQTLPDFVVIATGILHNKQQQPEKTITQVDPDWLQTNIESNLYPSLFFAKHLTKQLKRSDTLKMICVSARVASISDNQLGGWHSYRMSKAALNMLVKNIALEWKIRSPQSTIISYHPGTVDSQLSKPFQKNIKHDIFSPSQAADYLLQLQGKLEPTMSGKLFDWQHQELPF